MYNLLVLPSRVCEDVMSMAFCVSECSVGTVSTVCIFVLVFL